jgi:peptidoglycan/xylan/chitin deacetylase (PgdA/CDA1 family)
MKLATLSLSTLLALAFSAAAPAPAQARAQTTPPNPSPGPSPSIAFTFDDLPAHSALPSNTTRLQIAQDILKALHDAGLPPIYGFVNAADLEHHPEDAAVLDLWRKAGNPLGNHTWSHMNLNDHTVEDFTAEILRNEPTIRQRAGDTDWHWFRYPNLAEGNTPEKRSAVRSFLAEHHYKVAAVTMSFGDYAWNEPYARCVAKNDTAAIATLETTYLQAAADDIDYRQALAHAALGHNIPFVLLMHIGALDARLLPRLLALYKSKGFTFVTLPAAESDPFYANDLDLSLPGTPDTLEGLLASQHKPFPPHPKNLMPDPSVCR